MTAPENQTDQLNACDVPWTAVHDFMPPGSARLKVTGAVMTPTPGYTVTLTEAHPQGINPFILLLRLELTPPTGIVPQHVVTVPVEYEKETDFKYTQVSILPDGPTVDVEDVY
ncbi:MAG: hypothetical protein M3Y28_09265 [Armatimonadota bacterium]|nr:hypothetical protein [Armatimonadota bacterium]